MVIQLDSDCHFLTWIDNFLIAGNEDRVKASKEQINQRFDCDDVGELTKYVGCKTDRTKNSIKFTQPVLLQSIEDEFGYVDSKMKMWQRQDQCWCEMNRNLYLRECITSIKVLLVNYCT